MVQLFCDISWRHIIVGIYFMFQLFCHISWRYIVVGILDPCDAKINHIKCMWVSDLHFVAQWFWHILKTFWWRNVGLKLLIQCDIKFDLQNIYVGEWPIFCGTVILPYIFNTIFWTSLILWILVLIWAIDLYFMIKWFWIIYLFLLTVVCWGLIWKYLWM